MGEEVIISKKVISKLDHLEKILFENEYHGFKDTSKKYVDKILATIFKIPSLKHSKTKNPKVGTWFVRHKPNKQTTYYITFDCKDNRYLVKDIITNHEARYRTVIGSASS